MCSATSATLLGAVAHSPAMLFYLDNWQSSTPDAAADDVIRQTADRVLQQSAADAGTAAADHRGRLQQTQPAARPRRQTRGLNENYARELMELHTLGVDGGYTQTGRDRAGADPHGLDDRSAAAGRRRSCSGRRCTTTGTKTLLGVTFTAERRERGRTRARSAGQPSVDGAAHRVSSSRSGSWPTSRRPRSSIVRRRRSRTRRATCARSCARSSRRRSSSRAEHRRAKVKTPLEFVVSAVRATGATVTNASAARGRHANLGMPLYGCQPPTGYSMTADAWVNTGALLNRMNFAVQLMIGGRVHAAAGTGARRPPRAGGRRGPARRARPWPGRASDLRAARSGRPAVARARHDRSASRRGSSIACSAATPRTRRDRRSRAPRLRSNWSRSRSARRNSSADRSLAMMTRRIFLKNGSLALVSLGFAPAFVARAAQAAAGAAEDSRRDLPARRRRRPQHDRAVRRARVLPEPSVDRDSPPERTRRRARSRRLLRPAPAHGAARAALQARRTGDRPRLRLARRHALALRRAGLHGERHAGREEHARRLAESLPARAGTRATPAHSAPSRSRRSCRARCRARRRRSRSASSRSSASAPATPTGHDVDVVRSSSTRRPPIRCCGRRAARRSTRSRCCKTAESRRATRRPTAPTIRAPASARP